MLSPAFLGAINSKIESGEAVIKQIVNDFIPQNGTQKSVILDSPVDFSKSIPILIQHGEETVNSQVDGQLVCNMTVRLFSETVLQTQRGDSGGLSGNPLKFTVLIVEFPDAISVQKIESNSRINPVNISSVNLSNRLCVFCTYRSEFGTTYQTNIRSQATVNSTTQMTVKSGGVRGGVIYYVLELPPAEI